MVYCDVVELLGNKEVIAAWNDFTLLHHAGLSGKGLLEGMSRGAVYVYNWTAANPKKVASVYVDNPLAISVCGSCPQNLARQIQG